MGQQSGQRMAAISALCQENSKFNLYVFFSFSKSHTFSKFTNFLILPIKVRFSVSRADENKVLQGKLVQEIFEILKAIGKEMCHVRIQKIQLFEPFELYGI